MRFIKVTTVSGQTAFINLAHVAAVMQGERNDQRTWHLLCDGVPAGMLEAFDADAKELLEIVSAEIADAAALDEWNPTSAADVLAAD